MLLTVYLELFHGRILLKCKLRGCNTSNRYNISCDINNKSRKKYFEQKQDIVIRHLERDNSLYRKLPCTILARSV